MNSRTLLIAASLLFCAYAAAMAVWNMTAHPHPFYRLSAFVWALHSIVDAIVAAVLIREKKQ